MNTNTLHKVFISYHHSNDQIYKDEIVDKFNGVSFIDASVNTGDIEDTLSDEAIRTKIRDNYLKNSTVTIVLVGSETKFRKHVDWEIYSSMFDGTINKKSGILVINLPGRDRLKQISCCNGDKKVFKDIHHWSPIESYKKYEYLPLRILDNIKDDVPITVINYDNIKDDPEGLKQLIDTAYNNRTTNKYNLSRPLRRKNT